MKKNDEETKKRVCLGLLTHPLLFSPPVRRSADLQSAVKKCPNHFGLCGFAIRNKQECPYLILRDYKSPDFNRSNLFLRRISNPSGRLAVSKLDLAVVSIPPKAGMRMR